LRSSGDRKTPVTIENAVRRVLDVSLSVAGLIFLLPLIVVAAVLIKLQDGGPILFSQNRIGKGGRTFSCLKFRTMVTDAQERLDSLLASDPSAKLAWERDHKLKVDPRVTALGRFLRKTSIDEVPQLFNIILGDMSIVGPRPIVRAEIPRYGPRLQTYCMVKPGLTGLWQVSGRSNTSYRRRVAFDVVYVRQRSILLDLKIIVATVPAVLQSRGSY